MSNPSPTLIIHGMFTICAMVPYGQEMATFSSWNPLKEQLCPIYELPRWIDEGTHVGGAHDHDMELDFFQKPSGFDCGMDGGVCGGGVWGSIQLEDHFMLMRGQCVSILTK